MYQIESHSAHTRPQDFRSRTPKDQFGYDRGEPGIPISNSLESPVRFVPPTRTLHALHVEYLAIIPRPARPRILWYYTKTPSITPRYVIITNERTKYDSSRSDATRRTRNSDGNAAWTRRDDRWCLCLGLGSYAILVIPVVDLERQTHSGSVLPRKFNRLLLLNHIESWSLGASVFF